MSRGKRFGLVGVAASVLALMVMVMASGAASAAAPCQAPQDWKAYGGGAWSCDASGTSLGRSAAGDALLLTSTSMTNFDLSATVGTNNREASLAFRVQDPFNGYILVFMPDGHPGYASGLWLVRRVGGVETLLWSGRPTPFYGMGQAVTLRVVGTGSTFVIYVNGVQAGTVSDATFASGMAGFRLYGDAGAPDDAWFSNVVITSTTTTATTTTTTTTYTTPATPATLPSALSWCEEHSIYHADTGWYEWPAQCITGNYCNLGGVYGNLGYGGNGYGGIGGVYPYGNYGYSGYPVPPPPYGMNSADWGNLDWAGGFWYNGHFYGGPGYYGAGYGSGYGYGTGIITNNACLGSYNRCDIGFGYGGYGNGGYGNGYGGYGANNYGNGGYGNGYGGYNNGGYACHSNNDHDDHNGHGGGGNGGGGWGGGNNNGGGNGHGGGWGGNKP